MTRKRTKRRHNKSKSKGSAFERYVCRRLSLWVTDGKREDVYWRSAMSGGRATVRFKRGKSTDAACGDVSAIDPCGKPLLDRFFIECKAERDSKPIAYMHAKAKGRKDDHWLKPRADAAKFGRVPFVVVKHNNLPIMLYVRSVTAERLVSAAKADFKALHHIAVFPLYMLHVFIFDEVLKVVDPRRLYAPTSSGRVPVLS